MDSCVGIVTIYSLWGGVVSPTPNPQPGGTWYPFLSVSSLLTCLAWKALPAAVLPPVLCYCFILRRQNCYCCVVFITYLRKVRRLLIANTSRSVDLFSRDISHLFKIGGQIIHTVKYADDLVLLAKEGKCYRTWLINWNWKILWNGNQCGNNNVTRISKTAIPSINYDSPKTTRECGIF